MKFAADKSLRTTDEFGRLHVAASNISKAAVNGYMGHEIPDYQALGLDPDKIYQLFRDPEELRKGAATFNRIPILSKHVPISSADPQKDLVIGATGEQAAFNDPYLTNSLVIWTDPAIAGIETKEYCELSCCYRYKAVMTPGEYESVAFDGIMTDIIGNHVAIVDIGRAGPDVLVADRHNPELDRMKNKPLSRRGLALRVAIATALTPRLAADAALPDLTKILQGVTSKNMDSKKVRHRDRDYQGYETGR